MRAWLPCSAKPDRSWWPAKLARIQPTRDTAVRATIHIECTPAEARLFLGLPDVQPIQAAVLDRLQEAMVSEIDRFSPEALMNQWLSAFPENVERLQAMVATMFLGGSGQGRP